MSEIKQVSESFVNEARRASWIEPIYEWWDVPEKTASCLDINQPFATGIVVRISIGRVEDKPHYFIQTVRWP